MEALASSGWAWLLVLVAVLGLYSAAIILYVRSAARRAVRHPPVQTTVVSASVLEPQMARLQEQVARLSAEVERLKAAQQGNSPYSQAIAMARRGMSVAEIAAGCGISRGEAELIVALHRASLH